jgi:hypothetical protein
MRIYCVSADVFPLYVYVDIYFSSPIKTPKGLNKDSQIDETTYARMRWTSVLIIVICNFGCYFPEYSESLFLPLVTMVELTVPTKVDIYVFITRGQNKVIEITENHMFAILICLIHAHLLQ